MDPSNFAFQDEFNDRLLTFKFVLHFSDLFCLVTQVQTQECEHLSEVVMKQCYSQESNPQSLSCKMDVTKPFLCQNPVITTKKAALVLLNQYIFYHVALC